MYYLIIFLTSITILCGCQAKPSTVNSSLTDKPQPIVEFNPEKEYFDLLRKSLPIVSKATKGKKSAFEEITKLRATLVELDKKVQKSSTNTDIKNLINDLDRIIEAQNGLRALYSAKDTTVEKLEDLRQEYQLLLPLLDHSENRVNQAHADLSREQVSRIELIQSSIEAMTAGDKNSFQASKTFAREMSYFQAFLKAQRFGSTELRIEALKEKDHVDIISRAYVEFNVIVESINSMMQHTESLKTAREASNSIVMSTDKYIR